MELGRIYRGIEFIRLSDLPDELKTEIMQWVDDQSLLKIKTNEELFRDCILTKDFEYWYRNIHQPASSPKTRKSAEKQLVALQYSN
jgi:hypothetical protein